MKNSPPRLALELPFILLNIGHLNRDIVVYLTSDKLILYCDPQLSIIWLCMNKGGRCLDDIHGLILPLSRSDSTPTLYQIGLFDCGKLGTSWKIFMLWLGKRNKIAS